MDTKELSKYTYKLRVLYVEDEYEVRQKTEVFFKHYFNKLVVAADGEEGFELFKKDIFDIVITDLKMPKLRGEELIRKIKSLNPETIVIAMSGISDTEEDKKVESDFYIVKPLDIKEFNKILTQIIQRLSI